MRLCLTYIRGPELKFLGNLDTMRLLFRCIRRADLPFALSEGFNPHIKMSMGTVLPVGVWSLEEWLDLSLTERVDVKKVIESLNASAPAGLVFTRATYVDDSFPALMALFDSACYRFRVEGVEEEGLSAGLSSLLSEKRLEVKSRGKNKNKVKDLAPGLYRLKYIGSKAQEGEIESWVASGSRLNIRPDELAELFTPFLNGGRIVDCYRQGNYIKKGNDFVKPFEDGLSP